MIDTHAHLASPQLYQNIDHYLQLAEQAGVCGILCVGTTAEDSARCVELAERHPQLRAAVGIHPNYCHQASDSDWRRIEELALHPRVVAIGETGLDLYWDDCPWPVQVNFLHRHVDLARKLDLPIVVHTRDCIDQAVTILTEFHQVQPFSAVMHSFTGTGLQASALLRLGFYISMAGMLTFKNNQAIREVALTIPLDRILVETDCPYLTPHPFRGQKPNHPALARYTLECLAELYGISFEDMAATESANALRLFSHWSKSSV